MCGPMRLSDEMRHAGWDSGPGGFVSQVRDLEGVVERVAKASEDVLWFLDQTGGYHTFHAQVEELRAAAKQARGEIDA